MAILAAVLFAFLITRSIKKIDHAIRDLGAGELATPIQIDGPNDLKELGERLDWLRERISELENQKINFLRHVSHELKTPLTAIREAAELLTEEQQRSPEDVEIIQIIQESSLQLQELIEGLLQFGKTDNLFKPLSRESLHFPTLIKDVIAEYSLAMSTKQASLSTDLDDVMLYGDYERLRIVLNNLISNAVRYSPNKGHIQVTLASGIDHKDCPYVFEPFYRGRATETGPVKGTGLGLTIAKEYVEAHQGDIQVLNGTLGALLRVHLPLITV